MVAMIVISRSSDKHLERRWHLAIPATISGIGLVAATAFSGNPLVAMTGLSLGMAGLLGTIPTFWCLPSAFLGGVAAAAAIALINAIGSISGFVGPTFYGLMKDLTGSSNGAMYLFALLGTLGGFLAFLMPAQPVKS
jgi:nitrate/nitrite transporter NarK